MLLQISGSAVEHTLQIIGGDNMAMVSYTEFITKVDGGIDVIAKCMVPYPPYIGSTIVLKGSRYKVTDTEFNFDTKSTTVELVEV